MDQKVWGESPWAVCVIPRENPLSKVLAEILAPVQVPDYMRDHIATASR